MQQAADFLSESEALHALVTPLSDEEFQRKTSFKDWTINNVIGHLHMWNWAADLALKDTGAFKTFLVDLRAHTAKGGSLNEFEKKWVDGLSGQALVTTWREFFSEMTDRFGVADPARRVVWAGPDMSVRSSITARLMETWAHGQEVYDLLGVVRKNADRIRNIVVLGVNTYGWTFNVRGEQPPQPKPHLKLTAPSGELWTFNDPSAVELIEGQAEEFCQVVTQVRNIADCELQVTGPNASDWMAKAQCFAGGAQEPPAPGTRKVQ
ncbi:MAG: TIGR03084 family metal-binding protein [Gammaproteobacteria bacterium]|nr:TIGR03084 family metal-binding protein [Gammaproteobacteria bacterium]